MSASVSLREEIVLVQKRGEFGFLIKGCVRYRNEAVLVLLGTQYGSQCESKTGDCFSPKEGGISVHEKGGVRYRKEDVWEILGMQYGSQCESKTGESFGPKERGIWVLDKGLCEVNGRGCIRPVGDAI